jgi:Zn-dependent protease with chaperone function
MYARTGGILPSIYVRTWEGLSDRVYAVTAHELAHAAHWDMDRDAFRNLVVTWGVQNVLGLASASAVVEKPFGSSWV